MGLSSKTIYAGLCDNCLCSIKGRPTHHVESGIVCSDCLDESGMDSDDMSDDQSDCLPSYPKKAAPIKKTPVFFELGNWED